MTRHLSQVSVCHTFDSYTVVYQTQYFILITPKRGFSFDIMCMLQLPMTYSTLSDFSNAIPYHTIKCIRVSVDITQYDGIRVTADLRDTVSVWLVTMLDESDKKNCEDV